MDSVMEAKINEKYDIYAKVTLVEETRPNDICMKMEEHLVKGILRDLISSEVYYPDDYELFRDVRSELLDYMDNLLELPGDYDIPFLESIPEKTRDTVANMVLLKTAKLSAAQ